MTKRGPVLVAGIGNQSFGDDGFGPAVIARLTRMPLPDRVELVDYGIRDAPLAREVLDRQVETLVLVDAISMGEPAGTVATVEVDGLEAIDGSLAAQAMTPSVVLATLHDLGGSVGRMLVLGCQPATFGPGAVLSPQVLAAVDAAAALIVELASPRAPRRVSMWLAAAAVS